MRERRALLAFCRLCVAMVIVAEFVTEAAAVNEQVLYSFGGLSGFYNPGPLIFDRAGNLYGTAGSQGSGIVFELSPSGLGGWTQTTLHGFSGSDGANPSGPLLFDNVGNLYGMTENGGTGDCSFSGCGVIYELSPGSDGWAETVLYSFTGGSDGRYPLGGLVADSSGNLYGTASFGGNLSDCLGSGCGTVFMLARTPKGWEFKVLHSFSGGSDGAEPLAGLSIRSGTLYGTASVGGDPACNAFALPGCGTVFKMTPGKGGGAQFQIIYSLAGGTDGSYPCAGIIFDSTGNAYGTTLSGGPANNGTVFRLVPGAVGQWQETVLYSFAATNDGWNPDAPLVIDKSGNLYGTTQFATIYPNGGIVFRLSPASNGTWSEAILHNFTGGGSDGKTPSSGVIFGKGPGLYGSTSAGGTFNGGTVYEITK
jgi:uncharacterized repeat protein (TIGR03803 family)